MRANFLTIVALSCLCVAGCTVKDDRPPNLILILVDDFGVGDIQAHYPDNKIATPSLDHLASQGMRFTDAHSASAVCTPSRYSLLTGRYHWRTRLQEWVLATYEPPLISPGRLTVAGLLKQQGYDTAAIGKWHLGWNWPGTQPSRMDEEPHILNQGEWDFKQPIEDGPVSHGFDYFFGVDTPSIPPFTFIENDRVVEQPSAKYVPNPSDGIVLPTRFEGSPMAPDWKLGDILRTITERAVRYIHEKANCEEPFFLYFSMTSPHEPIVPSAKFRGKSGIAPIADFVMETDWSVGQIMRAIDDAGIADNTLVIFTADNGHSHYTGWEDLVRAGHMPSGPYRGHKGDIWEGGHRVPFLVRWPQKVEAGAVNDQLLSLNDVIATYAELLGVELPLDGAQDSFSFLKPLLGLDEQAFRQNLVSHSRNGEFAYREGQWKLIFKSPENPLSSRGASTTAELYDLQSDIGEIKDVVADNPDVVRRLTAGLQRLIDNGSSRPGPAQSNDALVRYDVIQNERWAPALVQINKLE